RRRRLFDLRPARSPCSFQEIIPRQESGDNFRAGRGHITLLGSNLADDSQACGLNRLSLVKAQKQQNFLCYSCKEYVEDLSKIPGEALEEADIRLVVIGQSAHRHIEPFCSLTAYPHEIYVDPERRIYQMLGMKREEKFTESAHRSPHVKSGIFMGQLKSIWRAMTSPAFDFQGDMHQQGGAVIAGPGPRVHFSHFDTNHLDHMPIDWLLQLAGVHHTLDFGDKPKIVDV
uniref:Peroxiredoxin like 2C n=1 Tax=Gasterosteus aculeatus aculeatus TaxID=481459 RepID=G3NUG0_GASAC